MTSAVLAEIRCPTLVINHVGEEDGRYLADHIPDARFVEISDPCHLLFSTELDVVMGAMSELINGGPLEPAMDRILTTLVFTDIVDSTRLLAAAGDRRWSLELDSHDDLVRRQLGRFGGHEVRTTGDGFVAMFDSPTRAVQFALALQHEAARRGLAIRAGAHTGEIELRHDDVLGVNVHVAQRVCALAAAGQVLVTQLVVDLVAGSELRFHSLGSHMLKGLDDPWTILEADRPGDAELAQ